MKTKDVMTREVLTVAQDASILQAARLMVDRNVSGLPVVDAAGTLVGIVTEGDFLRRAEIGTQRQRPRWIEFILGSGKLADEYVGASGRKVGEVMSKDVQTVREDTPLEDVVRLMERHRIKRVPVVTGKTLVGIVTRTDLLRALVDTAEGKAQLELDDPQIRECLLAELKKQPWAPLVVNVGVSNGVVTLSGLMTDERQRRALYVLAENIPGVRRVEDLMASMDPNPSRNRAPVED